MPLKAATTASSLFVRAVFCAFFMLAADSGAETSSSWSFVSTCLVSVLVRKLSVPTPRVLSLLCLLHKSQNILPCSESYRSHGYRLSQVVWKWRFSGSFSVLSLVDAHASDATCSSSSFGLEATSPTEVSVLGKVPENVSFVWPGNSFGFFFGGMLMFFAGTADAKATWKTPNRETKGETV